jgi:uncharacterized membrane protein
MAAIDDNQTPVADAVVVVVVVILLFIFLVNFLAAEEDEDRYRDGQRISPDLTRESFI